MTRALLIWTAVASILVGMPSWPASSVSDSTRGELELALSRKLDELRSTKKFPGATAAFVLCDGTSGAIASGYANVEAKVQMRPDDLMLSGSIGKTYVAVVLLQLVQEGRANLDDKLERYLGKQAWFKRLPNAHSVTIGSLLGHVSGIVDHADLDSFALEIRKNPARRWTPEEIVSFVLDLQPLGPVGSVYRYSDTNYILIGMVIEAITHSSYYAELSRRLLLPLNLRHTRPSNAQVLPGLVDGYMDPHNEFGLPAKVANRGRDVLNPQVEWTGGGLISNSRDIARWAHLLYGGKILDPKSLRTMLSTTTTIRPGAQYGLGVYVWQTDRGTTYGHQGDFPGYWSVMEYFPPQHLAIAMQFNSDDPRLIGEEPRRMAEELAAIVALKIPQCQ